MPEPKTDKIFFEFSSGINTEVSPLTFPDGVSLDEENFELLPDGTRRRRRGLSLETGGVQLDISGDTLPTGSAFGYHIWHNVGGDPSVTFIVVQLGDILQIYEDSDTVSGGWVADVDLQQYATTATRENISNIPCSFSDGIGYLFVSGPHMETIYIEWDTTNTVMVSKAVPVRIRDFKGVDDVVPVTTKPTTLSNDHYYNLRNRGWEPAKITQYHTDKSAYPAKNMIPWMGYRRATATGYYDADGNKSWNSTKLELEVFGASSAPQGSLFINPYNTTNSALDGVVGTSKITSWSHVDNGSTWTITINTTSAHGLVATEHATISGNSFLYRTTKGNRHYSNFNGSHVVVSAPSSTSFTITIDEPIRFHSWISQFAALGYVAEEQLIRSDGQVYTQRPRACAWYGSRLFMAGVQNTEYNDTVFFSQIVTKDNQFGKCYQENDPTAEHLNALLPTDGGTIQIPGMGGVVKMVPWGASLYIFTSLGIWELGPGRSGFFSADGYSVRKVADIEVSSSLGVVSGDFGIVFVSPRGIYTLAQDPNSGYVVPQSLSDKAVQSLWNDIPKQRQEQAQVVFDAARKKYHILYSNETIATMGDYWYDRILTYNVDFQAFTKLKFPGTTANYILGIFHVEAVDATNSNRKIKFALLRGTRTGLDIADMDHASFLDWDSTETIPYLLTGYDNVGDAQRFRQTPICHVFMKKTETSQTSTPQEVGPPLIETIGSSRVWLQARWDWADTDISGKFSKPQQVYRHVRGYVPPGAADPFNTGSILVVTRNKLRGRGRCLHLHFYGEEGYDAHLVGWALQYAVKPEV